MSAPEATLLLSTHCPHCPTVLQSLSKLVKKGELSQLHIANIEVAPDVAKQYGVRSVPWIKIGEHILTGLQPLDALKQRIEWSKTSNALLGEFDHLLSNAKVDQVISSIQGDGNKFDVIMKLLSDPATILSTRIGIGVVMEEFEGSKLLRSYTEQLAKLLNSEDNRIRADVAHYLSLTHTQSAITFLKNHQDNDPEVKEVIVDSLESLQEM